MEHVSTMELDVLEYAMIQENLKEGKMSGQLEGLLNQYNISWAELITLVRDNYGGFQELEDKARRELRRVIEKQSQAIREQQRKSEAKGDEYEVDDLPEAKTMTRTIPKFVPKKKECKDSDIELYKLLSKTIHSLHGGPDDAEIVLKAMDTLGMRDFVDQIREIMDQLKDNDDYDPFLVVVEEVSDWCVETINMPQKMKNFIDNGYAVNFMDVTMKKLGMTREDVLKTFGALPEPSDEKK